jgi:hypothetical protein
MIEMFEDEKNYFTLPKAEFILRLYLNYWDSQL